MPDDKTPIDVTPEDETPDTPAEERPVASGVAGVPKVRPAGPEAMTDAPAELHRSWDDVDQASDESFPSSDPPGQGVG